MFQSCCLSLLSVGVNKVVNFTLLSITVVVVMVGSFYTADSNINDVFGLKDNCNFDFASLPYKMKFKVLFLTYKPWLHDLLLPSEV